MPQPDWFVSNIHNTFVPTEVVQALEVVERVAVTEGSPLVYGIQASSIIFTNSTSPLLVRADC